MKGAETYYAQVTYDKPGSGTNTSYDDDGVATVTAVQLSRSEHFSTSNGQTLRDAQAWVEREFENDSTAISGGVSVMDDTDDIDEIAYYAYKERKAGKYWKADRYIDTDDDGPADLGDAPAWANAIFND